MQKINIHQTKLYAILEALLAFVAMLLPWTVEKVQFFQQGNSANMNGFRSWGFLTLIGIVGALAATLMGDKTQPYTKQNKQIAMASFAVIAIGAIAYFLALNSAAKNPDLNPYGNQVNYSVTSGMGLWLAVAAGVVGLAWVSGFMASLAAKSATTATTTTPPTPPTPPATNA